MKNFLPVVFILFLYSSVHAKVNTYQGRITVLFTDYIGAIHVNLEGENDGLIQIDVEKIIKPDGSSGSDNFFGMEVKEGSEFSVNAGMVKKIVISTDTFYRADLEDDYGKKKVNCFVKKIYGRQDVLLYQHSGKKGKLSYYLSSPKHDDAFANILHPEFDAPSKVSFLYVFGRCESLKDRLISKGEPHPFVGSSTADSRLEGWKKLIDEYDACELREKQE